MRVLVAPLDWGLGHASRCVPIIRALLAEGHVVILAATGRSRRFLEGEFPHLAVEEIPGYKIRYPRSGRFLLHFTLRLPFILLSIFTEHRLIKSLSRRLEIDVIISDNRYGLFSKNLHCIFITHQLFVRSPRLALGIHLAIDALVRLLINSFLSRYDAVWIPDFPGRPNLSGRLCHGKNLPANVQYIGPLSRFNIGRLHENILESDTKPKVFLPDIPAIDILALVSGPEPQRSAFEHLIRYQMKKMSGTRLLLRGIPPSKGEKSSLNEMEESLPGLRKGDFLILPHLSGPVLEEIIRKASYIVCRSGYTTVMELAALGKEKILLVPTPGQTEQEYLARFMESQGLLPWTSQRNMYLPRDFKSFTSYVGFRGFMSEEKNRTVTLLREAFLKSGLLRSETHYR